MAPTCPKQALAFALIGLALGCSACGTGGARRSTTPPVSGRSTHTAPLVSVSFHPHSIEGDNDRDGADGTQTTTSDGRRARFDRDDREIVGFGRSADSAQRRAITALFERYYRAIAADNGTAACSLLFSLLAESIPEVYGQEPGPVYLRGLKTCPAVVSLMLQHARGELASEIEVTGVRVRGKRGYVLFGSADKPASALAVHREGGDWKVDEMLPTALP